MTGPPTAGSPMAGPSVIDELVAALKAAMPYAADSARRSERLGLAEEAAAARDVHRRAQWALHAAGHGVARARDCED